MTPLFCHRACIHSVLSLRKGWLPLQSAGLLVPAVPSAFNSPPFREVQLPFNSHTCPCVLASFQFVFATSQFVSPSLWLRDPPCRRCLLLSVSVLSMYFFGFYGYFGYVLSDFNYFLFRYRHYQNIGTEYQKMPSIRRGENY